jgi:Fe-S-cluster-containing hydrogenase component 2
MCEACVNLCPKDAISLRIENDIEELLFEKRLCNGCGGLPYCGKNCPEDAIALTRTTNSRTGTAPISLMSGIVLRCIDCGVPFAPLKKIEAVLKKADISQSDVQKCCPACRREHLLASIRDKY